MATKPQTRFTDETVASLREATVQPSTWQEADRSFEVVWTTGAAVTRFDWWDGEYYTEELSVADGDVRLDRLQAGGPVLLDHLGSTRNLAGSIVPGSVRIEKGQGIARVRLADTPDLADIVAKVRDGHLRTVSVGYIVHTYERTEERGEHPVMRAIDWEPTEISLTPVPADAGAVVRNRSKTMTRIIDRQPEGESERQDRRDDSRQVYRGGEPSRRRTVGEDQILRACSRARLTREAEQQLLEEHRAEPLNEVQLYETILDLVSENRNIKPIDARNSQYGRGPANGTRELMADALYARLSGKPVSDAASEFAGATLPDMARAMMEERGERMPWARPAAIIDKLLRSGMHGTSDFAFIVDSAAKRFLIDAFQAAESPLKKLARSRTLPDFRAQYGVVAEGATNLLLVPEHGEFKRGTFVEGKSAISLDTYGRIFAITRQALINDDLGVFSDMAMVWSRAAAELEASGLASLINGFGATIGDDSLPIYDAAHGNLAGTGTAITIAALGEAREAMRSQKNRDGETFANVNPKYLVVGPAKETEAEQAISALSPAASDQANPFSGKLEVVVDPRLTGNSWRLFADPAVHSVMEYASLEGQEGLHTDTRTGFDVDGVEFKARMDVGWAARDYRGTYMNPGD